MLRRLAEAAEQLRKPQRTQTVYATGSMEWSAANVTPSERWRWGWDHEFESPLLQRRVSCEPDFRYLGAATRSASALRG
jgi:hypothetical protein